MWHRGRRRYTSHHIRCRTFAATRGKRVGLCICRTCQPRPIFAWICSGRSFADPCATLGSRVFGTRRRCALGRSGMGATATSTDVLPLPFLSAGCVNVHRDRWQPSHWVVQCHARRAFVCDGRCRRIPARHASTGPATPWCGRPPSEWWRAPPQQWFLTCHLFVLSNLSIRTALPNGVVVGLD